MSNAIGYREVIARWLVIKLLNEDNKNSKDNAKAIAVPIIFGKGETTPTAAVVMMKPVPRK